LVEHREQRLDGAIARTDARPTRHDDRIGAGAIAKRKEHRPQLVRFFLQDGMRNDREPTAAQQLAEQPAAFVVVRSARVAEGESRDPDGTQRLHAATSTTAIRTWR